MAFRHHRNPALLLLGFGLTLGLLALSFALFWPNANAAPQDRQTAAGERDASAEGAPARAAATARPDAENALKLSFPAGCTVGRDCWYFAYVDLDSGPGYRDYRCGVRSYQRHKGTDVAPVDPGARVVVSAAAGGIVVGRRDGMDDRPTTERTDSVEGSECGNGVRIDHGNGWVTQYCHLARGSVRVQKGARVEAGEALGLVGASGLAELPHLHFQLERDGRIVDPFTGREPDEQRCTNADTAGTSLWQEDVRDYVPTVVYRTGLLTEVPDRDRATRGDYPDAASTAGDALVAYAVVLGAPEGAMIVTEILGPGSEPVHRHEQRVERDYARFFSYSGRKRPDGGWRPGTYTARITVSGKGFAGSYSAAGEAQLILR